MMMKILLTIVSLLANPLWWDSAMARTRRGTQAGHDAGIAYRANIVTKIGIDRFTCAEKMRSPCRSDFSPS